MKRRGSLLVTPTSAASIGLDDRPVHFDDFVLVDELFRSNTGIVWKARVDMTGELVVLKERFASELGSGEDVVHEAKLLQSLDSPHVIKCYGYFYRRETRSVYIILEYAEGGDLYRLIQKRRRREGHFTEAELWALFLQVCRGLKHIHEKGIIHRDLKSLNLLLFSSQSNEWVVKIGDFGVGRARGENTVFLQTFYGTPLYASPELCDNRQYNEKTDIWSLGIILYELATFGHPFESESLIGLSNLIVKGVYEPVPARFGYSRLVNKVIRSLLQTDFMLRPSIARIVSWFERGRGQIGESDERDEAAVAEADEATQEEASAESNVSVEMVGREKVQMRAPPLKLASVGVENSVGVARDEIESDSTDTEEDAEGDEGTNVQCPIRQRGKRDESGVLVVKIGVNGSKRKTPRSPVRHSNVVQRVLSPGAFSPPRKPMPNESNKAVQIISIGLERGKEEKEGKENLESKAAEPGEGGTQQQVQGDRKRHQKKQPRQGQRPRHRHRQEENGDEQQKRWRWQNGQQAESPPSQAKTLNTSELKVRRARLAALIRRKKMQAKRLKKTMVAWGMEKSGNGREERAGTAIAPNKRRVSQLNDQIVALEARLAAMPTPRPLVALSPKRPAIEFNALAMPVREPLRRSPSPAAKPMLRARARAKSPGFVLGDDGPSIPMEGNTEEEQSDPSSAEVATLYAAAAARKASPSPTPSPPRHFPQSPPPELFKRQGEISPRTRRKGGEGETVALPRKRRSVQSFVRQRSSTTFTPVAAGPTAQVAEEDHSGNNLAEAKNRRDERLKLRWEQRRRRLAQREEQQKMKRRERDKIRSPPRDIDNDRCHLHSRHKRPQRRALTPLAAARAAIHGAREDDIYDYGDGDSGEREWERVRRERQQQKKNADKATTAVVATVVAKDSKKANEDAELEWLKHAPTALDTQQIEEILHHYRRLNMNADGRSQRKGRPKTASAVVSTSSGSYSARDRKEQASSIERAAARIAYERERRKMVARLVRGGHFGPPAHAGFDLNNDPALGSLGRRSKRFNIISGKWM